MFRRFCKRILTPPLIVVGATIMFLEEWVWDHLAAFMGWVARAPLFSWLEGRIATLPAYWLMAVFLLPGAMLLPVKLAALYFMARGMVLLGLGVLIGAKVIGTALVARMFVVGKPKLMTIGWFARVHDWVIRTKNWLYSKIASMPGWQAMLRVKQRMGAWLRRLKPGMISRRWMALRRRAQQKKANRVAAADLPVD